MMSRFSLAATTLLATFACRASHQENLAQGSARRLPTGQVLDPAGVVRRVGQMPLAMLVAPDGRRLVLLLDGWREQGLQVVDREGSVRQTIAQGAAFVGLAFSLDGKTLYASGGNTEAIYRYRWDGDSVRLRDSILVAPRDSGKKATHYPAGIALSRDGTLLYVAENLADSLAVVDLATGQVVQRLPTGAYPYAVVAARDGNVYVSNWGANTVSVFAPATVGRLGLAPGLAVGRHPSAMLLSPRGTRLFVASGSTDRVSVVDVRAGQVITTLQDPPPQGPDEGTTPNALALSPDGTRLFVAEADANAVAVFDLAPQTADLATAGGRDALIGRIPTGWYPTALVLSGDTLFVANGKGTATGPNRDRLQPGAARTRRETGGGGDTSYTLGQIHGALSILPLAMVRATLPDLTQRVARANGWVGDGGRMGDYPSFTHVIYVLKENRTYDQVLGDIKAGDGDTSLVLFGRGVTPNQHALAERFGLFDRFFTNAEVSADGHNWSMAAYATDYTQKTAPINYSSRGGRDYDYEGTNRGKVVDDDVAEPAQGYLWNLAERGGISFRNFGEFTVAERDSTDTTRWRYRGDKPYLAANTDSLYPGWDLAIPDRRRADVWLQALKGWSEAGTMPALQIVYLPQDHTSGATRGAPTPRVMVADNDLALGRVVAALTRSPFWKNTVVFVLEDDAQDGPDHVDSHRSPLLVISAYGRAGAIHRFTNTTDVLRTIEEILGLQSLSQFDQFGRPLRDIWADQPDTTPYVAITPSVNFDERNPAGTRSARMSERLDLATADAADMELFNRVLWLAVKGEHAPYPGTHRLPALELRRSH